VRLIWFKRLGLGAVMKQSGLFGLSDHLKRLSANFDPLKELGRIVDFDGFRVTLVNMLAY
jgi:hypothetical protein